MGPIGINMLRWGPTERYPMDCLFYFERRWNGQPEQVVETLGAEVFDEGSGEVFERRKTVRFLVNVNHNFAAWSQERNQAAKCTGDVRTMLQDSHAEDFVERSLAQRDLVKNAGLKSGKL